MSSNIWDCRRGMEKALGAEKEKGKGGVWGHHRV